MLPRQQRLHADRDIRRLLQRGARRRNEVLHITAAPSTAAQSRVAVVVSKQVAKRATDRNRIRRQVQAMLPALLQSTAPPTDILIRIAPAAAHANRDAIRSALANLWPTHGVTHLPTTRRPRRTPAVPANSLPRP